ncbi:hypothetical protein TA3x_003346 [Tundrisphaera sp. TA3]|uniref:hypothetical protein n=1 Tax=Tundrisphaera sp. TA3 TaxID=3435775 RepID=UPI003EBCE43F
MDEDSTAPRRRWRRSRFIAVGVGLAAILAGSVAWMVLRPRPFGEPLPDPNGYDDLVAAGRMIRGDLTRADLDGVGNEDQLRALVAANADALARARVGLGRRSAVSLAHMDSIHTHIDAASALRSLGRVMACEAALAEREGRPDEAVASCADMIRLGRAASRGGLILDRTIEPAIQHAAIARMARLAGTLPADEARRLARECERIDADREPLARVADRDLAFGLDRGGLPLKITYLTQRATMQAMLNAARKSAERADLRGQAQLRLIAATLALRTYALDHPDAPRPPGLAALVPAYLDAVPADPYGRGPLKTRVDGDALIPYSVGPDGRDDGGTRPASPNSSGGDLFFGPSPEGRP